MVDMDAVVELQDTGTKEDFGSNYEQSISEAIQQGSLQRDGKWTECIAVGSDSFVTSIEEQTTKRVQLHTERDRSGAWTLREAGIAYA